MTWRTPIDRRVSSFLDMSLGPGRVAPSYLLSGPDGVGVESLALELAQALLCESDHRPCGTCRHCSRVEAGTHADYAQLAPSGLSMTIGIDEIRDLKSAASLEPFEAKARVFAIGNAEAMTADAANALLKLLEEPPEKGTFVMTTANEEAVPETIRSRCQTLRLRPLPFREVEAVLVADGVEAVAAGDIARKSEGRIGLARSMADDSSIVEEFADARENLIELVHMPATDRLKFAGRLSEGFNRDREPLLSRLSLLESLWRVALLKESGAPGPFPGAMAGDDYLAGVGVRAARDALTALQSTVEALKRNANARVAMEALVLRSPFMEADPKARSSPGAVE